MKDLHAKREEERKQQVVIESWQEQEEFSEQERLFANRRVTSQGCTHVRGAISSGTAHRQRPQQLIRKAPPSHNAKPPPSLTTNDARVEAVSRRLKEAFVDLQEEAELDMLVSLLKDFCWSKSIRNDVVKVVELSHRESGQRIFLLIKGGPNGDRKVRLAHSKAEAIWPTNVDMSDSSKNCAVDSQEKRTRGAQRG